jgi:hypothetical protein
MQQAASHEVKEPSNKISGLSASLENISPELATVVVRNAVTNVDKDVTPIHLIHIIEAHPEERFGKETENWAILVQGQVKQVIQHLEKSPGLDEVFLDGLTPEALENYTKAKAYQAKLESVVTDLQKEFGFSSAEEFRKAVTVFAQDKPELSPILETFAELDSIKSFVSSYEKKAGFSLGAQGIFVPRPEPDSESIKKALELLNQHPETDALDPRLSSFFASREAALVNKVGNEGGSLACVVMGAAHFLQDDVQRWNEANPRRPILLVEIVPQAAAEVRKEIEQQRQSLTVPLP